MTNNYIAPPPSAFRQLSQKLAKISIIIITVLVWIFTWSCGNNDQQNAAQAPRDLQVEGYKVVPTSFNDEIMITAELIPSEQVELMAPMAGQVLDIYFKEGEKVKKGEAIVHIDDREWQAQLIGIKAKLNAAQKDYERKKALLEIEGSSQEEIDQAFSTIQTLKSQLQQLQVKINLARVKAPFSGQLGMRDFSKGAYLKEGQIITTLTAMDQLKVDFTVAQEHTNNVAVGKSVQILVNEDTLKATIYAISPLINMQSRMLNVRALLPQASTNTIIPGAYAEVLLTSNFVKDALIVPTQAVVPEINDQTVYVYQKGRAVKKVVQMGTRTADKVHILKGITAGDTVITTGLLQIKDGMNITLQEIN